MNYSASEFVVFIAGQLLVAAAIWGGIRADIRNMHERLNQIKEVADSAHERIDALMTSWANTDQRRGWTPPRDP